MKLGNEPKKVVALVSLVAVAAIVYWMNSSPDAAAPVAVTRPAVDGVVPTAGAVGGPKVIARREAIGKPGSVGDYMFKVLYGQDTSKVDPTIRFDLLAKVQAVGVEGGKRNIFQPASDPELIKQREAEQVKINEVKKIQLTQASAPKDQVVTPPPPPGPAPIPPINLKYYGYSTKRSDGEKKAFFLDGEDIIVASEGDVIKKQYKVVRIGVNSVQMEDTASKSSQTLPLQADAAPV
jgi:hypothetical protein